MATITPPSPLPLRSVRWQLNTPTQVNRSEWTGARQAVIIAGAARWSASGEMKPIIKQSNAESWQAFFIALRGQANVFQLRAVEAQQTASANPTVNGGSQTGNTLNLTGLSGSVASTFLPAGSKMTIPFSDGTCQLVVLTSALVVGASTTGTATIEPRLRKSPANAATVEVQYPYALMALTSDVTGWTVDRGQLYGFAFEAEEAF